MSAISPLRTRLFRVNRAMIALLALGMSGCGFFEMYRKDIKTLPVHTGHREAIKWVDESFLKPEEKKVFQEQLMRIKSAYLETIDKGEGEKGNWTFSIVSGNRLIYVAQVRALRDEFLPESGLSAEEKEEGIKICNRAMCALLEDMIPTTDRWQLYQTLQKHLTRLREQPELAAGDEEVSAELDPPAEPENNPKPPVEVVDHDEEVRQALEALERTLVSLDKNPETKVPAGPCEVDFAAQIEEDVDDFLEGRNAR